MTLLRIAYGLDFAVTLWFSCVILGGRSRSVLNEVLLSGTTGRSAVLARLIGSIWLAMSVALLAGICWPVLMAPILILQLIYKGFWLLVFSRGSGRSESQMAPRRKITVLFTLYCVLYPWVIPWLRLWQLAQQQF